MARPLRVLIVSGSPGETEAMLLALRQGGLDPAWERVETTDGLRAALVAGPWDAVVSDYALPWFGAEEILKVVHNFDLDLPVIIVSGSIGEDAAVALMRATASDYIPDHDLGRLAPAVGRAVREAAGRRTRRAADRAAAHLAAVVESSDDAIISKTLDGVVTSWNPAAERLYGWTAAEAVGRHIGFIVAPDKADELAEHMRRLAAGESIGYFETVRVHRDGQRIDLGMTLSPVRGADGRLSGVSKTARDIRERKRSEEALRASEERYRLLIESIPHLVWMAGPDGGTNYFNQRGVDQLRVPAAATHGWGWLDLLDPDDVDHARQAREAAVRAGASYRSEFRVRQPDASHRWYLSQGVPLRGPDGGIEKWVGTWTDIDGRKRAEDALRRTADLLTAVAEETPDAVFVKDRDGRYLLCNPAAAGLVGRPTADVIGQTDAAFFDPVSARRLTDWEDRVMASGRAETREDDLTAAGVTRTFLGTRAPYRDACGNVVGVIGVLREVTAGKRAAASLSASEARYRRLFEAAQDGILIVDPGSGRVIDANPFLAEMIGYRRDEVVGKELWEIGLFGDVEANKAAFRTLQAEGYVRYEDLPLLNRDGRQIAVEFVSNTYAVGDARVIQCNIRDISARKRAEETLRASEERFRAFMNHIPAMSDIKDEDGRFLFVNEAWRRQFGPDPVDDWQGKTNADFWPRATAELFRSSDRECLARDAAYQSEETFRTPSGRETTKMVVKFPIRDGGRRLIGGMAWDITDRKRAEETLRAGEARYRTLVAATAAIVWDSPPSGAFDTEQPGWQAFTGQTVEQHRGWGWLDAVHPDDRAESARAWAGAVAARIVYRVEHRLRRADGEYRHMSARAVPVLDPDGSIREWVGVHTDVTEKYRTEADLRLRDRAIQATTQGIVITDAGRPDDPIIYASPGFERMTGHTTEEVLGRNCRFLQGTDTDPAEVARLREAIRAGDPYTIELLNYRKDGTPFWNELSVSPVRDAAGRLTNFVGVSSDVTARRGLEQQFRQAQKMEAVGQLAGGVAHDFNNLLTVINGYSEVLLDTLPPDDPSRASVALILQAGQRSAGLTRQLLAFSRKQVLSPRLLDLNKVAADSDRMFRRLIGEDVRLATVLDPGVGAVRADRGQVEQVLMNLVVNARDAMPTGGRLTIETRNVDLDEAYARTHPDARAGPHVLLSVSDTGTGMPPGVAARVFEPFFTTKGPGTGTGLGLSTVYGIVKQSGGHVAVYSAVGVGTTFKVYLPRVGGADGGSAVGPESPPPRGTETILLVEDEPGVRDLASHLLTGWGYAVLAAADGEEAVLLAAGHDGPIHLLMTDVIMPGAGGRVVADQVAMCHPGVKVLFVSGYTDDAVIRHGVLRDGVSFLQKPFSRGALAFKVREVLDAPAAPGPG